MSSRLHSVRRSLFEEFEEEPNDTTSSANSKLLSKHLSAIRVKMNSVVVACIVIAAISFVMLSNEIIRNLLTKSGQDLLIKARSSSNYIQMNYQEMFLPALYGTLCSIFTMFIVYFDSEVPGLSPLPPFSPRKANQIRYAMHLEKTNNLSYFLSLASGIITFFILYL